MDTFRKLYTIIIFSENVAGVLNEITSVFTRRQINIESLNVSASSIEGLHRYTITCWSDDFTIEKVCKQISKKIGVVRANYYISDDIFVQEVALYKIETSHLLNRPEISKLIRSHGGKIVEVNTDYAIVSKEGLTDDIISLYEGLMKWNCVRQYVRSGPIAVTKSRRELISEYLSARKLRYEQQAKLHEQ